MQNKKLLIGVVVALAVVLAAMLIYNSYNKKDQQAQNDQGQLGQKQTAPKGELVKDFPKELVQSGSTNIESYTIPYDGSKQYTTNLTSDKSMAEVAKGYFDYFTKNGFVGIKQNTVNAEVTTLFAIKANANYSVVIQKTSTSAKTYITVSVLQK